MSRDMRSSLDLQYCAFVAFDRCSTEPGVDVGGFKRGVRAAGPKVSKDISSEGVIY
jgi:hypothetical protein